MDPQDPVQPGRFRFEEQHDADFDEMTFRLVRLEFPDVVKMDAPDGGADTLLPSPGHDGYRRAWQAKRYTGNVGWSKCKDSLDRAIATYHVSHVTFCFPRNLTTRQEALFVKHLVGRHAGVEVDYINASELTARLTGSEEGRRVAKHFFADRDLLERIERGQRAGGALADRRDAEERLHAVGEFMAGGDPYFAYPVSVSETGLPVSASPPGTVMSVQRTRGDLVIRTDAIPRDDEAMKRYGPRGRLLFGTDDQGRAALEALQRVLREGGNAQLDAGAIAWDQMPPMFADLVGSITEGTMRVVAPRPIPNWTARVRADTNLGNETMDFALTSVDPGEEWDFALQGTATGLTLTLRGRWIEARGSGQLRLTYTRHIPCRRAASCLGDAKSAARCRHTAHRRRNRRPTARQPRAASDRVPTGSRGSRGPC
jgi:hypothetical protein